MRTVRNGVFETNSSSCHVLTLMSSEDKDTQLPEWKDITDQDIKFMVEHKLRFMQPDYTAEELLDNVAELKLKHDTAYAVSLEKEY